MLFSDFNFCALRDLFGKNLVEIKGLLSFDTQLIKLPKNLVQKVLLLINLRKLKFNFLLRHRINFHLVFFLGLFFLFLYKIIDVGAAAGPEDFFMVGFAAQKLVFVHVLYVGVVVFYVFQKRRNLLAVHVPEIAVGFWQE